MAHCTRVVIPALGPAPAFPLAPVVYPPQSSQRESSDDPLVHQFSHLLQDESLSLPEASCSLPALTFFPLTPSFTLFQLCGPQHARHSPATGPLHGLFALPGTLYPRYPHGFPLLLFQFSAKMSPPPVG